MVEHILTKTITQRRAIGPAQSLNVNRPRIGGIGDRASRRRAYQKTRAGLMHPTAAEPIGDGSRIGDNLRACPRYGALNAVKIAAVHQIHGNAIALPITRPLTLGVFIVIDSSS